MSRELLERALDALDQIWDYGLENFPQETHETLMDDIKSFLSTQGPKPIAYWDTQEGKLIPAVPLSSERTCFKVPLVPLYLHPSHPFIRLTDEEILEIVGPYSDAVGGYTRKLFDKVQDKLEEKNK
jgi:hypothetical protein